MWISNLAINNKVAVYILLTLILAVGFYSCDTMPREAAPDVAIPLVIVSVPYVGVSPLDIEGLVTKPLERNLKGLKDIKKVSSVSKEGLSTISVEFNTGIDIEEAVRRVRDKVNSTRSDLPNDIIEPIISEVNISEFPIMYVNISGSAGLARLKDVADDMQDRVESIPGVLRADISGGLEREVQVNCDVYRMNADQISFDDISGAIRAENLSIPGGTIDDGRRTFSVRVPGEFKDVKPIEDIVIKMQNNKPIYIRDVADVDYSFEDRATYARLNNQETVTLQVRKRAGENLLRIADEVKKIAEQESKRLGSAYSIKISNDQSIFVRRSVNELENSIITGMMLVVLSLFMFFGFKNSLLISTAIPISMFIGFIVLHALGITLNMVVYFSLVLVLGILVDDAIVVIENIYRHQHEYGKSPLQAARDGASEVAIPVFTATLSVLAPFIPLLFWPGIVGEFMKYLPITLIVTMMASLFTAFVISPVQAAVFINYKREIAKARENIAHPHWFKKYNPITILYHKTDEQLFPYLLHSYSKALKYAFKHRGKVLVLSAAVLIFMILLFGALNTGVVFFPTTEPSLINVNMETPSGTSLEVTNNISKEVEKRIQSVPGAKDIEFISGQVGVSGNMFDFGSVPNKGQVSVSFYQKEDRQQSSFKTIEEIRAALSSISGADLKVVKQEMGPPVGAAVSIEIGGEDYDQLAALSKQIRETIKDIPGLMDLKDDYNAAKPELQVIIDREKAGMFYSSTGQIAMTIRSAVSGAEASKYRIGEDEYKIRVRLREDQRQSPEDLGQVRVNFMNRRGQLISMPISSVADITQAQSMNEIKRIDQKRVVTVTANVEGVPDSQVMNEVKAKLADMKIPQGYTLKFSGKEEEQKKNSDFLAQAFMMTIAIVFLLMVMEFNSIKVPIVIMSTVPLALVGVFLGLIVTRMPFVIIMTGVGIISLIGVVVRNAIVLLDFVKQNYAEGMPLEDALLEAGRVRLRPVVLTAAAAVLGVVPMATGIDFDWKAFHLVIGAESATFWGPLAVTIIFGLTISTFLTLVIVPTAYLSIDDWGKRLTSWWRLRRGYSEDKIESR